MSEIKPVAWMYEKQIEGIDEPTQVVTPYENPSLTHGQYPWAQKPLYAIPDTHRIVSVELLESAVIATYLSCPEISLELGTIIDKEEST
jgi:hypothetical protein